MTIAESPMFEWTAALEAPALPDGEVHVWQAALDVSPQELKDYQGLLDGRERERAGRFHRDEDRRRFVAAHGLLRRLLGRYAGAPPGRLELLAGPWGKPSLRREAGMGDVRFSMSHSEGLALFAFALGREAGVDVERIRPDFDWAPVARCFFSEGEIATLNALPAAARRAAFFSTWTCKEACVKAVGAGFSLPPERVEIRWEADGPRAAMDVGTCSEATIGWTLRCPSRGPDWAAAIAAEGRDWTLRLWRWGRETCAPAMIA